MSSSLRQRQRRQILEYEAQEKQELVEHALRTRLISKATGVLEKLQAIVVLVLVLILAVILVIVRPNLLPWNQKPVPRITLTGFFPSDISPRRDLPYVVSNFAIATTGNLKTREAVRYTVQQRQTLKSRSLKVVWNLWEQDDLDRFVMNSSSLNLCGDDFQDLYQQSPLELQHDLVLWCLLQQSRIQGIMDYGIQFYGPLRAYRNVYVKRVNKTQTLSSLLVLRYSYSTVPSKMLDWIKSYNDYDSLNYRQDMEKHLFQLILLDKDVNWTVLDADCPEDNGESKHDKLIASKK